MATLIEIKKRNQVIKNIYMITKVMQMISFSKMNKIKNRILNLKEISSKIDLLLEASLKSNFIQKKLTKSSDNVLNIVFGSDSGFCGSTNSSLLKKLHLTSEKEKVILFGKKIFTFLSKKETNFYKNPLITNEFFFLENKDTEQEIDNLCEIIFKELKANQFKYIKLSYFNFKNVSYSDFYEEIILENIDVKREDFIKFYLKTKIIYAYISSLGTIFANRIKSMENSNQNAKKISDYLTLHYNKTRQSKINVELLDIISGSL